MKKNDSIKLFLIGGCVGITLMIVSYIVANILTGNIAKDVIDLIKIFFWVFVWGGICFTIASKSIKKIEQRDLKSIERQKILKKQMKAISVIIIWFVILLIIHIIKKNTLRTIIALGFITVFALWGYGCLLSYLNLKSNMSMINTRK